MNRKPLFIILSACWAMSRALAQPIPSFEERLRDLAVPKDVIARASTGYSTFSGPIKPDPELGWVMNSASAKIGIDGSTVVQNFRANGARIGILYADRKARINTYGDSFTACTQVSDGETWQEYLAGHLGEPLRNFGVGGYGVHQSYLRMLREERTDNAAPYVILYIYGNDSMRSLFRQATYVHHPHAGTTATATFGIHPLTFKPYVEMDLGSCQFKERPILIRNRAEWTKAANPQWVVDHFKGDLAMELAMYATGETRGLDLKRAGTLAACLDLPFDKREPVSKQQADTLLNRYAQRASIFILDKARQFAQAEGKHLMVVLNSPDWALGQLIRGERRFDQELVDYLLEERIDHFDMNEVHLREFRQFKLSFHEYEKLYINKLGTAQGAPGHYSPRGNHFFAYSIKSKLVDWINPKPPAYVP